jgi:hypothetical protein
MINTTNRKRWTVQKTGSFSPLLLPLIPLCFSLSLNKILSLSPSPEALGSGNHLIFRGDEGGKNLPFHRCSSLTFCQPPLSVRGGMSQKEQKDTAKGML